MNRLQGVFGTPYKLGTGADILCSLYLKFSFADPSSGGSDDWAKTKAGVKYTYLLELRPDENGAKIVGIAFSRRWFSPP